MVIRLPWEDAGFRKKLREYGTRHASDPFAVARLVKDMEIGIVDFKEFMKDGKNFN